MVNILNTLIYNPMILNEIKIFRNKELNMINLFNTNLINTFNNVNNTNTFQNTNQINTQDKKITIVFRKNSDGEGPSINFSVFNQNNPNQYILI